MPFESHEEWIYRSSLERFSWYTYQDILSGNRDSMETISNVTEGDALPAVERRVCPQCRVAYPRTESYFYVRGNGQYEYCTVPTVSNPRGCHGEYWANRSARRNPHSQRFGIEIEFVGNMDAVQRECARRGIECRTREYTHETTRYWKVVGDGSVCDGGELVSPPLKGQRGFDEVAKACEAIRAAGGSVDRRCGLHVHLEIKKYSAREIGWVWRAWYNNQDLINSLVPPSRIQGTWSRPITEGHVHTIERMTDLENDPYPMERLPRYSSLNSQSYPKYGTIEVRLHGGTVIPKKIVCWTKFCRSFFTMAKSGLVTQADSLETLFEMMSPFGLDAQTRRYLTSRAAALATAEMARRARNEERQRLIDESAECERQRIMESRRSRPAEESTWIEFNRPVFPRAQVEHEVRFDFGEAMAPVGVSG